MNWSDEERAWLQMRRQQLDEPADTAANTPSRYMMRRENSIDQLVRTKKLNAFAEKLQGEEEQEHVQSYDEQIQNLVKNNILDYKTIEGMAQEGRDPQFIQEFISAKQDKTKPFASAPAPLSEKEKEQRAAAGARGAVPHLVAEGGPGSTTPDPDPAVREIMDRVNKKIPERNFLQKVKTSFLRGMEGAEIDRQMYTAALGLSDYAELKKKRDRYLKISRLDEIKGDTPVTNALLGAAGMSGPMAMGSMEGAIAAGTVTAIGNMGPQALVPEEIVTAPLAFSLGSGQYWYRVGVGSMYAEMRDKGIPHKTASAIAQGMGVPYAAIEGMQVGRLIPGAKGLLARAVNESLQKTLARGAAKYGANVLKNTGEEVLQEFTAMAAEDMGAAISNVLNDGAEIPSNEGTEYIRRLWDTAQESFGPMAVLAAPGAARSTARQGDMNKILKEQLDALPADAKQMYYQSIHPDFIQAFTDNLNEDERKEYGVPERVTGKQIADNKRKMLEAIREYGLEPDFMSLDQQQRAWEAAQLIERGDKDAGAKLINDLHTEVGTWKDMRDVNVEELLAGPDPDPDDKPGQEKPQEQPEKPQEPATQAAETPKAPEPKNAQERVFVTMADVAGEDAKGTVPHTAYHEYKPKKSDHALNWVTKISRAVLDHKPVVLEVAPEYPVADFFNGYTDLETGQVYLNKNADRPMLTVMMHESMHRLSVKHPDLYKKVISQIEQDPMALKRYKEAMAAKKQDPEKFNIHELAGDALAERSTDRKFWQGIYDAAPEVVKEIAATVKKMLRDMQLDRDARVSQHFKDFKSVEKVLDDVMATAVKRTRVKVNAREKAAFNAKYDLERVRNLRQMIPEDRKKLLRTGDPIINAVAGLQVPAMDRLIKKLEKGQEDPSITLTAKEKELYADVVEAADEVERVEQAHADQVADINRQLDDRDRKKAEEENPEDWLEDVVPFQRKTVPWRESAAVAGTQTNIGTYKAAAKKPLEKLAPDGTSQAFRDAKAGNHQAAEDIVRQVIKKDKVLQLANDHPGARIVPVHAMEESGRNQLPLAFAKAMSVISGLELETEISQKNVSGHRGKTGVERLVSIPEFEGEVVSGQDYILVDDAIASGGTLTALRDYIEEHGGRVVGVQALGASYQMGVGRASNLQVNQKTLDAIEKKLTISAVNDILNHYDLAENITHLTNAQARQILKYKSVDAFRAAVIAAGAEGREEGPPPSEEDLRPDVDPDPPGRPQLKDRDPSQLEYAKQLQAEIRRLMTRRIVARHNLPKRAQLSIEIANLKAERGDVIRNGIREYARSLGVTREKNNRLDTLLAKENPTARDFERALDIIDKVAYQRANTYYRNQVMGTIQKEYARLRKIAGKAKSTVDAEYNNLLKKYLDDLIHIPDKERASLEKTLAWFDQNPHDEMGDDLKNQVAQLFRREVHQMTNTELREVLSDIESLKNTGRTVMQEKETQRLAELEKTAGQAADDIAASGVADKTDPALRAAAGSKKADYVIKLIKKYGWSNIRPERIVEYFTDFKHGIFYDKTFKRILTAEMAKLENIEKTTAAFKKIHDGIVGHKAVNQVHHTLTNHVYYDEAVLARLEREGKKTLGDEFQLTDADYEEAERTGDVPLTLNNMMFIYANSQNESNMAHLQGTGFTLEEIEEITNALPEKHRAAVDAMIDYFDDVQYPRMNEVFRNENQIDMPKESRYFPIMNLETNRAENAMMADMVARYSTRMAGLQKGMTKHRIHSSAAFRELDYFKTVGTNLNQVEHYLAFNDAVREVRQFMGQKELRNTMVKKSEEATRQLDDWLRAVAYGRVQGGEGALDKISDFLRNNYVTSVLGLNLITMIKQPASFVQGMGKIHKGHVAQASAQFLRNPMAVNRLVNSKSTMMRNRSTSVEREIAEMNEKQQVGRMAGTLGKFQKAKAASMVGITAFDKATTNVLWLAKYNEVLNETFNEDKAVEAADHVIRTTQPMGGIVHLSGMNRGGGVARAYTMFTNQLNQNLNLVFDLQQTWGQRTNEERAEEVFYTMIAPATLIYMASTGGQPPWEDPEGWIEFLVNNITGGLPIANRLIEAGVRGFITDPIRRRRGKKAAGVGLWSLTPTPLGSLEDLASAWQAKTWGKKAEYSLAAVAKLTGTPYAHPRKIIRNLGRARDAWDYYDGIRAGAEVFRVLNWSRSALQDKSEPIPAKKLVPDMLRESRGRVFKDWEVDQYTNALQELKDSKRIGFLEFRSKTRKFRDNQVYAKKVEKTDSGDKVKRVNRLITESVDRVFTDDQRNEFYQLLQQLRDNDLLKAKERLEIKSKFRANQRKARGYE